jgi:hypothetical protein
VLLIFIPPSLVIHSVVSLSHHFLILFFSNGFREPLVADSYIADGVLDLLSIIFEELFF